MVSRLVTSAALLALLCAPGPLLYAPPIPKATAEGLSSVEKYVLDDANLIVVVNANVIAATPVFVKNVKPEMEKVLDHEKIGKHFKAFGVKPLTDLERVVVVVGQEKRNDDGPREERIQVLWQGKFDEKKLKAAFGDLAKDNPKEFETINKNGATIYKIGRDMYFAILDTKTIVMCPSEKIALDSLERASGKVKPKFENKELAGVLKGLSEKTPLQAVALDKFPVGGKSERQEINGKVTFKYIPITMGEQGLKRFTITGDAKDDVEIKVAVEAMDKKAFPEALKMLTDGFDKMKMEIDREGEREPIAKSAAAILKGVTVKSKDTTILFEGRMNGDDAKGFATAFFGMMLKELDRPPFKGIE